MIGIIIYIFFLILGYIYIRFIFKEKSTFFCIWVGGILGNLILMMGVASLAFIFKFTRLCHFVLIAISGLPLIYFIKKYNLKKCISIITERKKDDGVSLKIFLLLIIPITLLIAILMTNHILVPTENGGYASGQSTYGDLNMHIGFITSIAEQGKFPPDYVFLSGYQLNYPFFINMLSSSLYLFGLPLRWAILIPSYVIAILLVMGFYFVAFKMTKVRKVAVLATIFFFLCGGLGFSYFFEGAKEDKAIFTRIFTEYYNTPTNLNEKNIRWANSICDMIIPQRTTMAGWCVFLCCLWYLIDATKNKQTKSYITLGIIASCMPMIHTHSFLALGIISAIVFFTYLIEEKTWKEKKKYISNWLIYGGIVALIAFPQLILWTFKQTSGNEYFLRYHFNWVNVKDPYIWFYIKNWGIIALFAIPAILNANKDNRKIFLGGLGVFLLSEFIVFQPNEYDNNKLFFISYMIILIIVCDWLIYMWEKLKEVKGRNYLAIAVILLGTLSGILTIQRELYSGGKYETFSKDMIEMSEYIKENTEKDSIFLTSTTHINPVCSLAGRNVYVGSSLYVYYHGLGKEFMKRSNEVDYVYKATYQEILEFCRKKNIKYIYVGNYEKSTLKPNMEEINKLTEVKKIGTESLYKVY